MAGCLPFLTPSKTSSDTAPVGASATLLISSICSSSNLWSPVLSPVSSRKVRDGVLSELCKGLMEFKNAATMGWLWMLYLANFLTELDETLVISPFILGWSHFMVKVHLQWTLKECLTLNICKLDRMEHELHQQGTLVHVTVHQSRTLEVSIWAIVACILISPILGPQLLLF